MLSLKRYSFGIGCAVVLLGLVGCAKKKGSQIELVPAKGAVTLDGQPLSGASVSFYPEGVAPNGYFGSGAITDEQGHYEIQTLDRPGAAIGDYKVTISRLLDKNGAPPAAQGDLDVQQLQMLGAFVESIAPRYSNPEQTELRTNVEKGKPDGHNFELRSK